MNWELLIIAAIVTRSPAYVHTHCLRSGYRERNHFHVLRRIWRPCESHGKTVLLGCHSGYVHTYVVRSHGTTFMGLCHTAAILSRETKVALFYLSSLAPKFFTATSRVVKESFFSLSDNMAAVWIRPMGLCHEGKTCLRINWITKKYNGPILLFKTALKHWNCFMSSVAMDGKDGKELKFYKVGPIFSSSTAMPPKIDKKKYGYCSCIKLVW